MTEREHLLTCLAEECSEIIKEVTKILRFGLVEEDDKPHTTLKGREVEPNSPRLQQELVDLFGILDMIINNDDKNPHIKMPLFTDPELDEDLTEKIKDRQEKVRNYMRKAREYGTLE